MAEVAERQAVALMEAAIGPKSQALRQQGAAITPQRAQALIDESFGKGSAV
jgi:hypothetical protein